MKKTILFYLIFYSLHGLGFETIVLAQLEQNTQSEKEFANSFDEIRAMNQKRRKELKKKHELKKKLEAENKKKQKASDPAVKNSDDQTLKSQSEILRQFEDESRLQDTRN